MRSIVVCLCVLGSACSGQTLNSPTAPTVAASVSAATLRTAPALPFQGSLTAREVDVVSFPTLLAEGSAEGTATHLGRYRAAFTATVNVLDGRSTGSFTFTAANGDQLFSTFVGLGVGEPIATITETLTISGGTGRFTGASGTLTVQRILDLTTGVSSGSIEGSITMHP